MKARPIIEGAAFSPEVMNILRAAFDEAWGAVEEQFLPPEHAIAREVLAISMVSMAREDSKDVVMLREAGIRIIKDAYPKRFAAASGQSGANG